MKYDIKCVGKHKVSLSLHKKLENMICNIVLFYKQERKKETIHTKLKKMKTILNLHLKLLVPSSLDISLFNVTNQFAYEKSPRNESTTTERSIVLFESQSLSLPLLMSCSCNCSYKLFALCFFMYLYKFILFYKRKEKRRKEKQPSY